MKETLQVGLGHTRDVDVDTQRTIDFMGEELRVYATPWIVHDLEHTCRDLLLAHIDDSEDSVGARVEVEHLKPTPLGCTATHYVTIESIDRRRVTFRAEVRDELEVVATGVHTRFVVDKARLGDGIAEKKARLKSNA